MKKFILSAFVAGTFIVYTIHNRLDTEAPAVTPPAQINSITNAPAASPVPAAPVPIQQTTSGYKNGVFTGNVADAYYGNVQVQVTVQNGKITDVQFLDYPHDRGTSVMINSQAMPYLKQEAIQAQSAQVDTVSGATQTSGAFRESLQAALNQAK